jgi:hypothetical protein
MNQFKVGDRVEIIIMVREGSAYKEKAELGKVIAVVPPDVAPFPSITVSGLTVAGELGIAGVWHLVLDGSVRSAESYLVEQESDGLPKLRWPRTDMLRAATGA